MFASPSSVAPAPPPSGNTSSSSSVPPQPASCSENPRSTKRTRRPAGTPDPDAEVVSLSPRTLLESDRYVCDICNQGFQREQNLQMHRRRHKVPWKLVKREGAAGAARKRVFVCPEPSCLHHDPSHALGDLVGIKKHFRRKHSEQRQWACARCSKAYAVHSDYKAHLKTCGTRGHSCDCGRVFSRVENFIEHQDACNAGRAGAEPQAPQHGGGSRSTSSASPLSDAKPAAAAVNWPTTAVFLNHDQTSSQTNHILELQLLPTSSNPHPAPTSHEAHTTRLRLSIGRGEEDPPSTAKIDAVERLRMGTKEKEMAEEALVQARRNAEVAEQEFASATRIRQQARAELEKAYIIRDEVAKRIDSVLLNITCDDCRRRLLLPAETEELPVDGEPEEPKIS